MGTVNYHVCDRCGKVLKSKRNPITTIETLKGRFPHRFFKTETLEFCDECAQLVLNFAGVKSWYTCPFVNDWSEKCKLGYCEKNDKGYLKCLGVPQDCKLIKEIKED